MHRIGVFADVFAARIARAPWNCENLLYTTFFFAHSLARSISNIYHIFVWFVCLSVYNICTIIVIIKYYLMKW